VLSGVNLQDALATGLARFFFMLFLSVLFQAAPRHRLVAVRAQDDVSGAVHGVHVIVLLGNIPLAVRT
jgi:hypothetical protein